MHSVLRLAALSLLLLAAASLVAQRNLDEHMTDAAGVLYQRSAFAHGYLHGYEQGFHLADLDIQMGHLLPGVHARRDAHDQDPHYSPAYGDKALFVAGFKLGMRAGYADSLHSVPFQAIAEMREAARGLSPGDSRGFDRAFYEGFVGGEHQGAGDARLLTNFDYVRSSCHQRQTNAKPADAGSYCDGYARGFRLGYDDGRGQLIASGKSIETAENSKGH